MNPELQTRILQYLEVEAQPPSLEALNALLFAYVRKVPWESISRIARKATLAQPYLMPEAFWQSAMLNGTGGTCYESNYAFLTLLQSLGYVGYLTLNNMHDKIGCHSAIVIMLDDARYLVDVGMPLHCAIPILPSQKTEGGALFHTYSITPQGDAVYLVERDNHPSPYCYTLIDVSIPEADYQKVLINDYGDGGLFLDRAIITKVINDQVWRFDSQLQPVQIEIFSPKIADKVSHFLADDMLHALAGRFAIASDVIQTALQQVMP